MDSTQKPDAVEIIRGLKLILEQGQVTELRVLQAVNQSYRQPHTESGYFDDPDKLAEAVRSITRAPGFYFVPNVVNPALLARANNRLRAVGKEPTTADHDIERRRWLLIDADAKRPAGISASDQEHDAAIGLVHHVRDELTQDGWPAPIVADSGNGAHLLYRVDLPADDGGLIKRCLEALAVRFNTDKVHIDTTVHNGARIWKLYGTVAAKGDSTPERPHRLSRILETPGERIVVSVDQLEALAGKTITATMTPSSNGTSRGQSFDIDTWIGRHGLEVVGPEPWQGGRKWIFPTCPWNSDHTNRSAFVLQQASGAIAAGCHHSGCAGNGWHELRDTVEPGWQNGKRLTEVSVPITTTREPTAIYRPFPVDALPEPCSTFCRDAAAAIGCDETFVVLPLLASLAGQIGNSRSVSPKPGWVEVSVIWSAVVAESGSGKSPALDAVTGPIHDAQGDAARQHQAAIAEFNQQLAMHDADMAAWKKDGRKKGEPPPDEPVAPVCLRHVVSDATVEALAVVLEENPRGLLLVRDELAGFIGGMDQYKGGKGGDVAHYLSMHGARQMIIDRKGTNPKDRRVRIIPRAALSICGGIQPEILRQALGRTHFQDGLAARFLLAAPPPRAKRWTDASITAMAIQDLAALYTRLRGLEPEVDDRGEDRPVVLTFTQSGQAAWIKFFNEHAELLAKSSGDMAAALAKLEGGAARLALLVHCVRQVWFDTSLETINAIDEASVLAGVTMAQWFADEAARIYGVLSESDEDREVRELTEWITKQGGRVSPRDLQRGPRAFKGTADECEMLLINLVNKGLGNWLAMPTGDQGGRPARVFQLGGSGDSDRTHEILVVRGGSVTSLSKVPGDASLLTRGKTGVMSPVTTVTSHNGDDVNLMLAEAAEANA